MLTSYYKRKWTPLRRYKMNGSTMIERKEYFTREDFENEFGKSTNALNQARQCANGYEREVIKKDKNGHLYSTMQRAKSYKGFKWEWI